MRCSRLYLPIATLFVLACSGSGHQAPPDAGRDSPAALPDGGAEIAKPADLGSDPAVEVPADAGPDVSTAAEAGAEVKSAEVGAEVKLAEVAAEVAAEVGAGDGPVDQRNACYWQESGGRYMLPHFTFLLTTPDGQAQTPPRGKPGQDAAGPTWPINDFVGQVASRGGNQFTVDSCVPPATCEPALYRFTLCNVSGMGGCGAVDSPAPIELPVPVGRSVRVVWHLDNDVPGWCPGLYFLAVYDAEPGPGHGNLLFLGSGGRQGSTGGTANPLKDLPFSVATERRWCDQVASDAPYSLAADDYSFVFSPKNGGSALRLGTGESGAFEVAAPGGGTQWLRMHCLDAVQPGHTDDYWNWDFWGAGEADGAVDAGSD
jgi:hypothetical protein